MPIWRNGVYPKICRMILQYAPPRPSMPDRTKVSMLQAARFPSKGGIGPERMFDTALSERLLYRACSCPWTMYRSDGSSLWLHTDTWTAEPARHLSLGPSSLLETKQYTKTAILLGTQWARNTETKRGNIYFRLNSYPLPKLHKLRPNAMRKPASSTIEHSH